MRENKRFTPLLFLSLVFIINSCSCQKEEPIVDKSAMWKMAQAVEANIEFIIPKDIDAGVNCADYTPVCVGAFKVGLRSVEMIILEYTSIKAAQMAAISIDQYYYKNWVFDDVRGEPVLESFVKQVYNAKRPNVDELELVKRLGKEMLGHGVGD